MAFDPKTATPVEAGAFDPATAKPVTIGGEFGKGVKSGVSALKDAGLGVVSMLADAAGAERVGDWALGKIKASEEASRADAPAVGSYEQVGGLKDAALYASAGLGQLAPFMVSSIASGGVGGVAGRMLGRKAAEEAAKRAIVSGAGEKAAIEAARKAAAGSANVGATTGLAANTIATESGLIQGDIYKDTGSTDAAIALKYGIPAGLLDVLPQVGLARRLGLLKGATEGAKRPGFISSTLRQTAEEGTTEAAQTVLERKAVEEAGGSEALSREGISEIINAGIIGALGGGVMGGGGHAISRLTQRAEQERPPNVGPLSGAANTAVDSGAVALELAAREAQAVKGASAGAEGPTPPGATPGADATPGVNLPPGMTWEDEAAALARMESQGKRDTVAMRSFAPDTQPPPLGGANAETVRSDAGRVREGGAVNEGGQDQGRADLQRDTQGPGAQALEQAQSQVTELPSERTEGPMADLSMQNRDRTRAASVAQMKAIAADPDFDRLGEAPTPDVGAPMASVAGNADSIQEQDIGKAGTVTMADGTKIPVHYAVLEAADVLPSHEADGNPNDAYYNPQPGTIRALNNARTAGVRAAYAQGTAERYKANLIAQSSALGLDPRAVMAKRNPILVRLYDDDWNSRADLGKISNAPAGLTLSPSETAMNDARNLDMGAFKIGETGEIDTAANAPFLRGFVQGLPENERGELMTADGRPTRRLAERVRSAMFAKAFQDPGLVAAITEETDPDLKNVLGALTIAAPGFANIPEGASLDLRSPLVRAVRFMQEVRRKGMTFDEALAQEDMFGRDTWTDHFTRFLAANIRSPKRMGVGLSAVADFITQETEKSATGDMFGGERATLGNLAKRVNTYLRGKYGEEARTFGGETDQPAGEPPATAVAASRRGGQSRPRPGTAAHAASPDLFGGSQEAVANVPRRTVESGSTETKEPGDDKGKQTDAVQLRRDGAAGTANVPEVSRRLYADLEKIPPADFGPGKEGQLQELRQRLFEAGEAPEKAVRAVWGDKLADAPPGLRQAIVDRVAVQGVSLEAAPGFLTGESDAEIRKREFIEKRAAEDRVKRERAPQGGALVLTGSNRAADANPDQIDLFSRPAPKPRAVSLEDVPPALLKRITVPVEQMVEGEGVKTVQMTAADALAENADERSAYEQLLECIKGAA